MFKKFKTFLFDFIENSNLKGIAELARAKDGTDYFKDSTLDVPQDVKDVINYYKLDNHRILYILAHWKVLSSGTYDTSVLKHHIENPVTGTHYTTIKDGVVAGDERLETYYNYEDYKQFYTEGGYTNLMWFENYDYIDRFLSVLGIIERYQLLKNRSLIDTSAKIAGHVLVAQLILGHLGTGLYSDDFENYQYRLGSKSYDIDRVYRDFKSRYPFKSSV